MNGFFKYILGVLAITLIFPNNLLGQINQLNSENLTVQENSIHKFSDGDPKDENGTKDTGTKKVKEQNRSYENLNHLRIEDRTLNANDQLININQPNQNNNNQLLLQDQTQQTAPQSQRDELAPNFHDNTNVLENSIQSNSSKDSFESNPNQAIHPRSKPFKSHSSVLDRRSDTETLIQEEKNLPNSLPQMGPNLLTDSQDVTASNNAHQNSESANIPQIPSVALPHDLTPIGMFLAAHWIVKIVMLLLLAASVITWIVLIVKATDLHFGKKQMRQAVNKLITSSNLQDALKHFKDQQGVAANLIQSAQNELKLSLTVIDSAGTEGLKERVESALSRIEIHAGRRMASGTAVLATIGSISPFVGLFGTVWGIMNSFIGISQAQTTNLAVVAPGIAEALLATAIGLIAAIPAVIIYNFLAKSISGYRQIVTDASAAIMRIISRELDFCQVHKSLKKN